MTYYKREETEANPWIKSLYSGTAKLASSIAKMPALLYSTPSPMEVGASIAKGESPLKEPPEALYKNALTKAIDESASRNSYMDEKWHSKGENLISLVKEKRVKEIPEYLAHAVVSNAPQQIAIIASTLSGLGVPALIALGGSAGAEAYSKGLEKMKEDGSDVTLEGAYGNAIANGAAEIVFERLGTMGVTKRLASTLSKSLGKKTSQEIMKDTFKEIAKSVTRGVVEEGTEEALTAVAQGISENVTGVDSNSIGDILADAFESGVVGGLSSATITAPISGLGNIKDAYDVKKYKDIVEKNGGTYVGIQKGFNNKKTGKEYPSLVMFNGPDGSTRAIPRENFTELEVKKKLDPDYKKTREYTDEYIEGIDVRYNYNQVKSTLYQDALKDIARDSKHNAQYLDELLYRAADYLENPNILDKPVSLTTLEAWIKENPETTEQELNQKKEEFDSVSKDTTIKDVLPEDELKKYADAKKELENNPKFNSLLMSIMQDLQVRANEYLKEGILDSRRKVYIPHNYLLNESFDQEQKKRNRLDSTKFRKKRVYDTLAEALAKGFIPLRTTLTGNYENYTNRQDNAIAIKRLKKQLVADGLVTTNPKQGYKQLGDDSTFLDNKIDSKTKKFISEPLYADPKIANEINVLFKDTPLRQNKFLQSIRKINAYSKKMRLVTGLFHHLAFELAYYFTIPSITKDVVNRISKGDFKGINNELNPFVNYKNGIEMWKKQEPIVKQAVKNGLTLGRIQDWDDILVKQRNALSKMADKFKLTKTAKNKIIEFDDKYTSFLFGKLGAGLKIKAYNAILAGEMKRIGETVPSDKLSAEVAQLVNENFGGLNLKRMRRNPTLQYIWQFFSFASDWTESNFRLYANMILGDTKTSRDLHKRVVGRIISKYIIGNVLLGLLSASMREEDEEERDRKSSLLEKFVKNYQEAWKDGKLNWMRVNVTPFLEKFGAKDRYYYNLAGFFLDPTKWISRDITKGESIPQAITKFLAPERLVSSLAKSAYYKSSALPQMVVDYLMDTDYTFWKGFTNLDELVDKKKLTKWEKRRAPVPTSALPSYTLYEGKKFLPLQINNAIEYSLGQVEGVEAVLKSLGIDVKRGYAKKER